MRLVNGIWYSVNNYSARLIKKTGLKYHGGFLLITVLADHLAKFNIAIKIV